MSLWLIFLSQGGRTRGLFIISLSFGKCHFLKKIVRTQSIYRVFIITVIGGVNAVPLLLAVLTLK